MMESLSKPQTDVVQSMESYFKEFEEKAAEWSEKAKALKVTNESETDLMAQAREARLALRDIRLAVVAKHKELKEDALRKGQTLDLIKRRLVGMIEPTEDHLQSQEDFIKIKENKRIETLNSERIKLLSPYVGEQAQIMSLGLLADDAFEAMLAGYKSAADKKAKEDEKARLAKIKADEDDLKERQRIAKENEKLRAEQLKANEKLSKERAEKKKLEDEIKAKADKEERERQEKLAAERKAKRAPDKEKLLLLVKNLGEFPLPTMKDDEAQDIISNVQVLIEKIKKYIISNVEKL